MSVGYCRFHIPTKISNKIKNNSDHNGRSKPLVVKPKVKVVKIVKQLPALVRAKTMIEPLASKYGKILKNPFAPEAMGCRCPDSYSFPTATYHLHGTTVLTSAAAGSYGGQLAAMFTPNPLLSMVDLLYDKSSYATSCVSTTSCVSAGATSLAYGATTQTQLNSVLSTSRVVSWGIKISNLQPELAAAGKVFIALVPTLTNIPSVQLLASVFPSTGSLPQLICGLQTSALATGALEEQPTSNQMVVQDLLHGDVMIAGSYTNPDFFTLRSVAGSEVYSIGTGMGTQIVSSGTNVLAQGDSDQCNMMGGVAIVLYAEGLPMNSPCFDIEYIYHLEGTPTVTTVSGSLANGAAPTTMLGTRNIVESAMNMVAGNNSVSWIDKGLSFANNAAQTIGRMVKSPAGRIAAGFFGL